MTWSVDGAGSRVGIYDGRHDVSRSGHAVLGNLNIKIGTPITVRVGIKGDAVHHGGVNLFGNDPQDPLVRYHYKHTASR